MTWGWVPCSFAWAVNPQKKLSMVPDKPRDDSEKGDFVAHVEPSRRFNLRALCTIQILVLHP